MISKVIVKIHDNTGDLFLTRIIVGRKKLRGLYPELMNSKNPLFMEVLLPFSSGVGMVIDSSANKQVILVSKLLEFSEKKTVCIANFQLVDIWTGYNQERSKEYEAIFKS